MYPEPYYGTAPGPPEGGCCRCFLVSEACFRRSLGPAKLNPNLTFEQMEHAWRVAHDLDVIPLLGAACYEALCDRLGAEPVQTTAADERLLRALEPFAVYAVYYRLLEFQPSLKVGPAGVILDADSALGGPMGFAHAEPLRLEKLLASVARTANAYRARFVAWLDAHRADYPCLPPATCPPARGPGVLNMLTSVNEAAGCKPSADPPAR